MPPKGRNRGNPPPPPRREAPPPLAPARDWRTDLSIELYIKGYDWEKDIARSLWRHATQGAGASLEPTPGAIIEIVWGQDLWPEIRLPPPPLPTLPPPPFEPAPAPPPTPMGLSPITTVDTAPTPPPTQPLGLSPITNVDTEPLAPPPQPQTLSPIHTIHSEAPTSTLGPVTPPPTREKAKRKKTKARKTTPPPPVKRQSPAPAPTPAPAAPTPPQPRSPPPTATKKPSARPDPPTKTGIVIHGIALRRELGNVRRWLAEDNKDMKKIVGIRWLRKKDILIGEGKKTSSIVVYLEEKQDTDKVRLGGRWLKASQYETERGRR